MCLDKHGEKITLSFCASQIKISLICIFLDNLGDFTMSKSDIYLLAVNSNSLYSSNSCFRAVEVRLHACSSLSR